MGGDAAEGSEEQPEVPEQELDEGGDRMDVADAPESLFYTHVASTCYSLNFLGLALPML